MTTTAGRAGRAVDKQLRNVHEVIARALTAASGDDYDALSVEDQGIMSDAAIVAAQAHLAWLEAAGFRLIPPGMTLRPQSENEAREMAIQVRKYLDQPEHARNRRRGLIEKPKLILPFDA